MPERLKRGDYVRVRREPTDEWTRAFVALASDGDPSSVMLMGNGPVRAADGFISNGLPLTIHYAERTVRGLITDDEYEIEVQANNPEDHEQ